MLGYFHDMLDEVLASLIGRVCLSSKDKLHGAFWVIDNRIEPIEVGKEQVGTLVGGKTTSKPNGQYIIAEGIEDLYHLTRCKVGNVLTIC